MLLTIPTRRNYLPSHRGFKQVENTEGIHCRNVGRGQLINSEDIVLWTNGRVLISAGDLARYFSFGHFAAVSCISASCIALHAPLRLFSAYHET